MKSFKAAIVMAAVLAVATSATLSAPKVRKASKPKPAPVSAAAGANVMAVVNGIELPMDELNEILVYSMGYPNADQLIRNELVRQEAIRLGITVTDKDVQAEHNRALEQMLPGVADQQDREKMFERSLVERNIPRKLWDSTMRRQATLTKIAAPRLKVTDDQCKEAFEDLYGRKFICRHIQVPTIELAQEVMEKLNKGTDFAEMVRVYSTNPATKNSGGQLMPITAATRGLPLALKNEALSLKKAGQISAVVKSGKYYQILILDQIVYEQDVRYDNVRGEIRKKLEAANLAQLQTTILEDLVRNAREKGQIHYVNPVLKKLDEQYKVMAEGPK